MTTKQLIVLLITVAVALPVTAQMGMMGSVPKLSGVWHPEVGSGAAYERVQTDNKEKMQIEVTIVGKDDMDGKTGYWEEFAVTSSTMPGGQMMMKELMSVTDAGLTSSRMIVQPPGQGPMEIDTTMMPAGRGMRQSTPVDVHTDKAEVVGTESVTVPAGTFSCEHIHAKDGSNDVWISDKVTPWNLVKYTDSRSTTVLTKVITDAKDRITGTPTKFDPMQMMRNMPAH